MVNSLSMSAFPPIIKIKCKNPISRCYFLCCAVLASCACLVSTVTDLEGMIQGQKQLMEKLTDECKQLTGKLEEATIKHK